jgi:hypothetical protein
MATTAVHLQVITLNHFNASTQITQKSSVGPMRREVDLECPITLLPYAVVGDDVPVTMCVARPRGHTASLTGVTQVRCAAKMLTPQIRAHDAGISSNLSNVTGVDCISGTAQHAMCSTCSMPPDAHRQRYIGSGLPACTCLPSYNVRIFVTFDVNKCGLQYLHAAHAEHMVPVCPVCRQRLLSTDPRAFEIDEATVDAMLAVDNPVASGDVAAAFERTHARAVLGPALAFLRMSDTGPIASCALLALLFHCL